MITLFADEQILTRSNDDVLILTTHRICYESRQINRQYNQSIPLEDITSCENYNSQQIWLLILGGILLGIGLYGLNDSSNNDQVRISIVIGIFCVIGYFLSKRNLIIISSPSTKMKIPTNGMSKEQALNFVNKVEQAKNNRLKHIHQK